VQKRAGKARFSSNILLILRLAVFVFLAFFFPPCSGKRPLFALFFLPCACCVCAGDGLPVLLPLFPLKYLCLLPPLGDWENRTSRCWIQRFPFLFLRQCPVSFQNVGESWACFFFFPWLDRVSALDTGARKDGFRKGRSFLPAFPGGDARSDGLLPILG